MKLWGEDALLGWAGALGPVIEERDAYMARAIMAAATGRAEGLTPAFVRGAALGGTEVLRYLMPEGGAPGACPRGEGEGAYAALPGVRAVVAVVGTAHVRGMVREWRAAAGDSRLEPFL